MPGQCAMPEAVSVGCLVEFCVSVRRVGADAVECRSRSVLGGQTVGELGVAVCGHIRRLRNGSVL